MICQKIFEFLGAAITSSVLLTAGQTPCEHAASTVCDFFAFSFVDSKKTSYLCGDK